MKKILEDGWVLNLKDIKNPVDPIENTENVPWTWAPEYFKWIPVDVYPDAVDVYNECIEIKCGDCTGDETLTSVLFTDGTQFYESVDWEYGDLYEDLPFMPTHWTYIPSTRNIK